MIPGFCCLTWRFLRAENTRVGVSKVITAGGEIKSQPMRAENTRVGS